MGKRVVWLNKEAEREHVLPRDFAVSLVLYRFNQVRESAVRPTKLRQLFEIDVKLYCHGWIPSSFVASLSMGCFQRTIVQVSRQS